MDRADAKSVQPRAAASTSARANPEGGRVGGPTAPGIAEQQLQERAMRILANNQLLLRFAVANELVSLPVPICQGEVSHKGEQKQDGRSRRSIVSKG